MSALLIDVEAAIAEGNGPPEVVFYFSLPSKME
jgi:hypothetical protein